MPNKKVTSKPKPSQKKKKHPSRDISESIGLEYGLREIRNTIPFEKDEKKLKALQRRALKFLRKLNEIKKGKIK
jgi:hypothetical protein